MFSLVGLTPAEEARYLICNNVKGWLVPITVSTLWAIGSLAVAGFTVVVRLGNVGD